MLNIVQIGAIGHYEYALPTAKRYGMRFGGILFPHEEDDRARTMRELARFGFAPRVYDDIDELMDTEKPDIAIVNTVMAWNAKYARAFLEKGISVFCEKPLATTIPELDALEKTYREAKKCFPHLTLCGMFGIDYLPHFETAYRFVKTGALGDIRLATAQKSYRMGTRERFYSDRMQYGGTIPWVAIHAIEWIVRIGGLRPTAVTAYGSTACNAGNGTMEASVQCLFACEGDRMAMVSADVMRPRSAPTHDDDRLRFVGSLGILEVRDRRVFVIDDKGDRELSLVETEMALFEEMTLAVLGKGVCRVSAEDSFFATRTALLARESEDAGHTILIT